VVTGVSMFNRSIGSAVGVAVYGAIANGTLKTHGDGVSGLTLASHRVFLGVVATAVLTLIAVLLMPKVHVEAPPAEATGTVEATAAGTVEAEAAGLAAAEPAVAGSVAAATDAPDAEALSIGAGPAECPGPREGDGAADVPDLPLTSRHG